MQIETLSAHLTHMHTFCVQQVHFVVTTYAGNLKLWKNPYMSLSLSPNILVYPSSANPDAPPLLFQSDIFPTQYCVNVTPPSGTEQRRLVSALLFRVEDIDVTPRNYSYFWIVSVVLMNYISLGRLVCSSSKYSMHIKHLDVLFI